MNIDKSRIIGKSIKDIPKEVLQVIYKGSHTLHHVWKKSPQCTTDFLSRCTLRYANSYGATYQISQTKELTIVSNKGQSYTLESYTKFLDLIIVDYQDPSENKPMKIIKQSSYKIGDRAKIREDLEKHPNSTSDMCKLAGTTVTITGTEGRGKNGYEFKGCSTYYWSAGMFEGLVIEDTQPADIKVGTHWERLHYFNNHSPKGEIITISEVDTEYDEINWFSNLGDACSRDTKDFLDSFKPRPDLDNPPVKSKSTAQSDPALPFSVGDTFIHPNYGEVTITAIDLDVPYPVRYDGPNCPGEYSVDKIDVVEEFIKQSKPVASKKEANPKPTKSENTFMSKIKATALTTVDQNKQAAIIASKMEAGRILNKQIIKQVKPHIPMFFRGYLDTPLAPVILANLVALAGNHTDNKRIKQISELMLLAAADTTVQSFNLDQIIDDVLKNIKLPAGILDDNDDN